MICDDNAMQSAIVVENSKILIFSNDCRQLEGVGKEGQR